MITCDGLVIYCSLLMHTGTGKHLLTSIFGYHKLILSSHSKSAHLGFQILN